tara:strand:- start:191 stop:436 length:246 start_codon:yes stop_codon:yes gene_type:complete
MIIKEISKRGPALELTVEHDGREFSYRWDPVDESETFADLKIRALRETRLLVLSAVTAPVELITGVGMEIGSDGKLQQRTL